MKTNIKASHAVIGLATGARYADSRHRGYSAKRSALAAGIQGGGDYGTLQLAKRQKTVMGAVGVGLVGHMATSAVSEYSHHAGTKRMARPHVGTQQHAGHFALGAHNNTMNVHTQHGPHTMHHGGGKIR